MSLRSPTEDEMGVPLDRVLPFARHSRARGNPGLFRIVLIRIPQFKLARGELGAAKTPNRAASKSFLAVSLLLYCSNGFRTALTNVVGLEAECIGFAAESLLLAHDSLSTAEFGLTWIPAFAGMTKPSFFILQIIPIHRIFQGGQREV